MAVRSGRGLVTLRSGGADGYQAQDQPIAGCSCHPSCGSCGFNEWPTASYDCMSCAAHLELTDDTDPGMLRPPKGNCTVPVRASLLQNPCTLEAYGCLVSLYTSRFESMWKCPYSNRPSKPSTPK